MKDVNELNREQASADPAAAFLEALYGDPLRTETIRTGRQLVIVSLICIVAVLFDARLQSTSLIPLEFGARTDVLPMLLSLAVTLLAVSFILRAATDIMRDQETSILIVRYIEGMRTNAARKEAEETDYQIAQGQEEDDPYGPDPWWEGYLEVQTAANAAISEAEERIGVRRLPQMLRRLRKSLEVGVPVIFAALALILSRKSLLAFGRDLSGALLP